MSISSALQTGVQAGCAANQKRLAHLRETSQTRTQWGYRRRRFAHMVTTRLRAPKWDGRFCRLIAVSKRLDISTAGGLISTNSPTDLAIAGNGFSRVSIEPVTRQFRTNYMAHHVPGSFPADEKGQSAKTGGYYLAGYSLPAGWRPIGSVDRTSFSDMETVKHR